MTHSQQVGQRIAQARREKAARERRDILRGEVAQAVGVDPSTITAWEQGKKSPREDALAKLAAFLGVTPAYLRYGVGEGAGNAAPLASYQIPVSVATALEATLPAQEPPAPTPVERPRAKSAKGKR